MKRVQKLLNCVLKNNCNVQTLAQWKKTFDAVNNAMNNKWIVIRWIYRGNCKRKRFFQSVLMREISQDGFYHSDEPCKSTMHRVCFSLTHSRSHAQRTVSKLKWISVNNDICWVQSSFCIKRSFAVFAFILSYYCVLYANCMFSEKS